MIFLLVFCLLICVSPTVAAEAEPCINLTRTHIVVKPKIRFSAQGNCYKLLVASHVRH